MEHYDNNRIKTLLVKFADHLTCWKVGISFGSFLYFEMGDKLITNLGGSATVETGSTTIVLEGDDWTILRQETEITNSGSVTYSLIDTDIKQYFIGKPLTSIEYDSDSKTCRICFNEKGHINDEIIIIVRGKPDEDMVSITFPNDTIIVCNAEIGFVSDN
jgi:hypothetical protein